jgi:hypothetical protein
MLVGVARSGQMMLRWVALGVFEAVRASVV